MDLAPLDLGGWYLKHPPGTPTTSTPMPSKQDLSAVAILAAFACACQAGVKYHPVRVDSTREAGSVHVAVLSVAPWERYVAALQPKFELTSEQALGAVLRDSRRVRTETLNAIGVSGEYKSTEDGADGRAPGGGASASGRSSAGSNGWEGKGPDERPDAMLEYSTATALYQEVQLLNRYVQDAAIPAGHRAYVVRMQVSLMPRRRHEPYDAYTTIGFFTSQREPTPEGEIAVSLGGRSTPGTQLRGGELLLGADGQGARVIPLLVTENLESSLESRMAQSARALSLSLSSFAPDIAKGVGLDALQASNSASVYARDLNGLLTVARLSENSLRVRLGAMQESTANYAMVPRTHNITVLLTLPETAAGVVDLVARTVLVDAESGEALPGTRREEIEELTRTVLADYGLAEDLDLAAELLPAAQANHEQAFMALLQERFPEGHVAVTYAQSLWIDLMGLMAGSQYASSRFELPGHGDESAVLSRGFHEQTPILLDDGRDTSTVRIRGIRLPDEVELEVLLEVVGSSLRIALTPESVERDDARGELGLVFPSLEALDLYSVEEAPGLRLRLIWGAEEQELDVIYRRNDGAER